MSPPEWKEASMEESHLRQVLSLKLERYFRYRVLKRARKKCKRPFTLQHLRKLQTEINTQRLIAGLPRTRMVQETLEFLKVKK